MKTATYIFLALNRFTQLFRNCIGNLEKPAESFMYKAFQLSLPSNGILDLPLTGTSIT